MLVKLLIGRYLDIDNHIFPFLYMQTDKSLKSNKKSN